MVFGLGLVVVMLGALLASGLWGLASLRAIIQDESLDAATASEVVASVVRIRATVPDSTSFRSPTDPLPVFDPVELHERIVEARSVVVSYRARLAAPELRLQKAAAWNPLGLIERRLSELQGIVELRKPLSIPQLRSELDLLSVAAADLPELPGLHARLDSARGDYRTALTVVWVSSAFVFFGLLALVVFGIRHVFRPVNTLHQGARRVAQGDFGYRVAIDSDDEMGELAESFNRMAERFQEIAENLEREVEERSRQLVRSDRLASVGFLAAGVAHEVNNPLTAIRWSSESLESRLAELLTDCPDDEVAVVQQYVTMIQTESERCQEITKKLLDFSRSQDSHKGRQDVVSIIREVLSLITHMKKFREARLELNSPDQCEIEISGHEIKQVLLNLVANALDSTDGKGNVSVDVVEQVDWVEILITDDGCGMSGETIDNLFQPFFTTKETGQGTGLGLSISDRIVTDHGGRISASSDGPGRGSTFTVRLPVRQKVSDAVDQSIDYSASVSHSR
jgi:signal transduction histidine kinase